MEAEGPSGDGMVLGNGHGAASCSPSISPCACSSRVRHCSEIKLLQELNHPNVLKLMDIFNHHSNINLVLEYMTGDLEQLLRGLAAQHKPLPHGDIKAYLKMILQGMEHCHNSWILHRDMKPVHNTHSHMARARTCAQIHASLLLMLSGSLSFLFLFLAHLRCVCADAIPRVIC